MNNLSGTYSGEALDLIEKRGFELGVTYALDYLSNELGLDLEGTDIYREFILGEGGEA